MNHNSNCQESAKILKFNSVINGQHAFRETSQQKRSYDILGDTAQRKMTGHGSTCINGNFFQHTTQR